MTALTQVQEIFGNQDNDPIPLGLKVDDLVHGLRITGVDPSTGQRPEGIEAQMANAFENMRRCIEAAGGSVSNIAQVSFFLKDFQSDRAAINPPWVKMFGDENDRPTYKFMRAEQPGDQLVQLEFWAVLGQKRKPIQIPKVAHTNPIPMGVRIGRYLFSSRILPMDPNTGQNPEGAEAQLNCTFGNASTLLDMAGLKWGDVLQGRAFIADLANLPVVSERWASKFPDKKAPPLAPVKYQVGNAQVYIEIIAAEAGS